MKKILLFIAGISLSGSMLAQQPKLVVGIVVDQMRYDYLFRFWDKYSEKGFKKLLQQGFVCHNVQYNYMPTYTGPGHASIYTGTTPAFHGIIANNWFDKTSGEYRYCVQDDNVTTVGCQSGAGKMSPENLLATTITDQLKLATNFKAKVIGISLKDRGAILPAGHFANAAYWFEGDNTGKFISSSFYISGLPKWVKKFNDRKLPEKYLQQTWNTLLPVNEYQNFCAPDDNAYESPFKGKATPEFPYVLPQLKDSNHYFSLLKATPFGNSLVTEMAKAAVQGEALGKDDITDFLTVSYSSTDYVGHQFGPQSVELADTYLRLDLEIAALIEFLETTVGKDNFILFLTADHAAAYPPQYLNDNGYKVFSLPEQTVFDRINTTLTTHFHTDSLLLSAYNQQLYFNDKKIARLGLSKAEIIRLVKTELLKTEGIYKVYSANDITRNAGNNPVEKSLQLGFNQKLSGDILYLLSPGWLDRKYPTGTTHGSPYRYDTHVPLIFYGKNIPQGKTYQPIAITDIAPTLAAMLHIQEPNACIGNIILPLVEN